MKNQCYHSTKKQRNGPLKLLQNFEYLFDGTLGTQKTNPVDLELKSNAKLICSRTYAVLEVYKEKS